MLYVVGQSCNSTYQLLYFGFRLSFFLLLLLLNLLELTPEYITSSATRILLVVLIVVCFLAFFWVPIVTSCFVSLSIFLPGSKG